jgi:phage terminase small subunit
MARGGARSGAGRKQLGAELHVLKGTFKPGRHGERDDQPQEPRKGRPEAPMPLEGAALAEWDRTLNRLESAGTLSVIDDAAVYQRFGVMLRATAQHSNAAPRP